MKNAKIHKKHLRFMVDPCVVSNGCAVCNSGLTVVCLHSLVYNIPRSAAAGILFFAANVVPLALLSNMKIASSSQSMNSAVSWNRGAIKDLESAKSQLASLLVRSSY